MSKFYHVVLEEKTKDKRGNYECTYAIDMQSLDELKEDILQPYVDQQVLYIDGRYIDYKNIYSLKVKSSESDIQSLISIANASVSPGVMFFYNKAKVLASDRWVNDITKQIIKPMKEVLTTTANESPKDRSSFSNNKVFIVHGHDDHAKIETARFIEKAGLDAIILHEQPSGSKTIIEKIESFGDVGFAIILYTPCDLGAKKDDDPSLKLRARQNVVFEHGYFIGRLGRSRVAALVKDAIETPNDISGVVYTEIDARGAWKLELAGELKAAGYKINPDALF